MGISADAGVRSADRGGRASIRYRRSQRGRDDAVCGGDRAAAGSTEIGAAEPALGADETPVNVLSPEEDPETGEPDGGSQHVLIIRPPGGKLTWLRALGSRRDDTTYNGPTGKRGWAIPVAG